MRNKTGIIVLTAIVTILCIYYLSFTFVARQQERKAVSYATLPDGSYDPALKQQFLDSIFDAPVYNLLGIKYTYKEVKENELSLGLDLQGGMHVTLEVSPVEILKGMAGTNSNDPKFVAAIERAKQMQRNSQENFTTLFYQAFQEKDPEGRLSRIFSNAANRGRIDSRTSDEEIKKIINKEVDDAIDRSFVILRARIDKFGVIQPNIQRIQGTGRIQVELPGVENPQRVRNLLQGVAQLEFREVYFIQEIIQQFQQANEYLITLEKTKETEKGKAAPTDAEKLLTDPDAPAVEGDTALAEAVDTTQAASKLFTLLRDNNTLRYEVKDTAKVNAMLNMPKVKSIFSNVVFFWDRKPMTYEGISTLELVPVKKGKTGKAPLTGEVIVDAREDVSSDGRNFEVSMQMNSVGAKKWRQMTKEASEDPRMKRRIAIVLDNYVYSAPVVQNEIPHGNSSITGNFSFEEAKDLANILKAGKLPAPVRIVEEAIVGPTLGKEAIDQGLFSLLAGLLLVVIIMVMYYSKGGIIANVALLFNIIFILGVMASFNSVLTLPGMAGIVLTIGMAVDANILIFERIREELRGGKELSKAIDLGYSKAFSSIFDSNVTTVLSGAILFALGSGPVKGFATTLVVGVFCSFFTAVYITRVIITQMIKNKDPKAVTFSTFISRDLFKNLNFDFIGKRKFAYVFSSALVVFGMATILMQGGLNLGVDFKGGRSYVVQFKENIVASELRTSLSDNFKDASTEVKTFGSADKLKITTSFLMEDESSAGDEAVEAALMQGLNEHVGDNFEVLSSAKVGATVADDIQRSSMKAVVLALLGIFLYIFIRFRRWQFGLGGLVALFHDALIVIGIFSILRLFGIAYEIDQVFIAAILTIIGFSINDTVIVFDRVREYTAEYTKLDLPSVLNKSINSTLTRTIMTTLTVLVVIVILFLFGGETLRGFSFALLIGVILGTYSTIFIAVPIVLDIRSKKSKEGSRQSSVVSRQ